MSVSVILENIGFVQGGFCPTPQKGTFQPYAPLLAGNTFV
jgi:hypothetical protein